MNLEQYINALKWHDWDYEYSDDYSVVSRTRKVQHQIEQAQPALDPDFHVWNRYAPTNHKRGNP
jgi:hypothetical protein